MVITLFRSRLRPETEREYEAWAARMTELATQMPGYVCHKTFIADDGERITVTEFESEEAQSAWRGLPEHVEAQRKGKRDFYLEYQIQVCELLRCYGSPPSGAAAR